MKESGKACKESSKACEESCKAPWKYLTPPFGNGFLKHIFCPFENSLLGYNESLFQKESPEANAIFYVFEIQCPKIMILSKAQKAKLSSLSMPGPRADSETAARPSFDHPRARGPLEAPSLEWWGMVFCVAWFTRSFGCSLSLLMKEGRCLSLVVWQDSWPNFKWLPKLSEVATNHWVFLRCDLLIPSFVRPRFACWTQKNPKIYLSMEPREYPEWCGVTHSDTRALKVCFLAEMTKTPLISPGFDQRSNEVKTLAKQHFSWFYIKLELLRDF